MEICAWTEKDIAEIAKLERVCFHDPWSVDAFLSSFAAPFVVGYVAREESRLVGYAVTSVLFEEAELLNVATAPDVRGRGIGSALLNAFLTDAKRLGAQKAFLEVRVSNVSALSLYRKFAFKDSYVRKKYYEDGEDALVMEREL